MWHLGTVEIECTNADNNVDYRKKMRYTLEQAKGNSRVVDVGQIEPWWQDGHTRANDWTKIGFNPPFA
jgi:hypothetical protein